MVDLINILKETPITLNGVDCLEVLIEDYSLNDGEVCDKCMYRSWHGAEDAQASCLEVHGCTENALAYFIAKPLP